MRKIGRLLGFVALPVLGIITPLLALPTISSLYGSAAWASIAIGQSVGGVAATVIELGWAWNGPMRVARGTTGNRRATLALAWKSRLLVAPLPIALAAVTAATVAPAYAVEAAVAAVGTTLLGFSTAWYFFGQGRAWTVFLIEAVPRLALVATSCILMIAGAGLASFAIVGVLLPAVLAPLAGTIAAGVGDTRTKRWTLRRIWWIALAQSRIASARVLSSLYMSLPTTLVGLVAPLDATATFAAGDRVTRMGLSGLAYVPTSLQKWVGRAATSRDRLVSAHRAIRLNLALGIAGGIVAFAALPLATDLLFSGTATVDGFGAACLGLLVVVVSTSRAVGGLALVVTGQQGAILASAATGAVIGVPGTAILSSLFGANGAFGAAVCAESGVLLVQVILLRRGLRRLQR